MSTATIEKPVGLDDLSWQAHAHVDKFDASAERDTLFSLFGERAREMERAGLIGKGDRGGLVVDPQVLLVPVSALDLLRPAEEVLGDGLILPRITGELMGLVTDPKDVADEWGNLLCNAGINGVLGNRLVGGTATAYTSAATALGAGDTSTAAAATQTDLSAAVNAANRYIQLVDSAPTFSTQVMTCVATFATGNGNFAWAEWIIAQNTSSGANAATASVLNRKVASLGTKTSAAAWTFTVTITIS